MAEPSLQEIFGANATQTATEVIIRKGDLLGLTASANNTGESLFVGILITAKGYLTESNFDENIDQNVYIDAGIASFRSRGTENISYRTDQLTTTLAKVDINNVIDPNNY